MSDRETQLPPAPMRRHIILSIEATAAYATITEGPMGPLETMALRLPADGTEQQIGEVRLARIRLDIAVGLETLPDLAIEADDLPEGPRKRHLLRQVAGYSLMGIGLPRRPRWVVEP